jgi:hypothetical protein
MTNIRDTVGIIGADRVGGGLLVHFSNQTSTLFHADFLYSVRDHDGNVPIVAEGEEDHMMDL